MSEVLPFIAAPAAACIILAVIMAYFGLHVLRREIIFIDLSMAQLAALGTTLAFVMNIPLDSPQSQFFSLGLIIVGACFFSIVRFAIPMVPQEAIIGIIYVVSSALTILAVDQTPHGAEHIKDLLNGSILWISWAGVLKLIGISVLVGGFHWKFQHHFLEISNNYREKLSKNQFGWDFLFYLSLGLIVVVSVKSAGIFLIFSFLIIPAACGLIFSNNFFNQWMIGAAVGTLGSILGITFSTVSDLPTGSALVTVLGALFLVSLLLSKIGVKKGQ
ncbi:MAG: zinc/manganese transport system permease protein [Nitrospinales bacterium]|jgi:zinc/manganese transport system permease protein